MSYMLAPVLKTYASPDEDDSLQTTNNPHVMHYVPNVSNGDIGGATPGQHPLPFVIQGGPHGFTIQHLGETETAAITKEYQEMLTRLCRIRHLWCLSTAKGH